MNSTTCPGCGVTVVRHPGRQGRPRRWCAVCRPAGAPPPSRRHDPNIERRRATRARTAARAAAYRTVARAHPDEYRAALETELARRLTAAGLTEEHTV